MNPEEKKTSVSVHFHRVAVLSDFGVTKKVNKCNACTQRATLVNGTELGAKQLLRHFLVCYFLKNISDM